MTKSIDEFDIGRKLCFEAGHALLRFRAHLVELHESDGMCNPGGSTRELVFVWRGTKAAPARVRLGYDANHRPTR